MRTKQQAELDAQMGFGGGDQMFVMKNGCLQMHPVGPEAQDAYREQVQAAMKGGLSEDAARLRILARASGPSRDERRISRGTPKTFGETESHIDAMTFIRASAGCKK